MAASTMGVKLDDQIRFRLKSLGQKKDRSPHWLMKKAIVEFLDREERYEEEKAEDLARWERYLDTAQHVSHDDVKKRIVAMIRDRTKS